MLAAIFLTTPKLINSIEAERHRNTDISLSLSLSVSLSLSLSFRLSGNLSIYFEAATETIIFIFQLMAPGHNGQLGLIAILTVEKE